MSMRDALIVSTARTAIGRAYKGAFNATPGATLGGFSVKAAVERAGIATKCPCRSIGSPSAATMR